jgi:hypothetical protein
MGVFGFSLPVPSLPLGAGRDGLGEPLCGRALALGPIGEATLFDHATDGYHRNQGRLGIACYHIRRKCWQLVTAKGFKKLSINHRVGCNPRIKLALVN